MNNIKVTHSIIKIVGLLGDYPTKKRKVFQHDLLKSGFKEDGGTKDSNKFIKDLFYSDFRSLMFIKYDDKYDEELLSRRFYINNSKKISFVKRGRDLKIIDKYAVEINKAEIFLFGDQIGLFSLSININETDRTVAFISDVINQCRNFDSETDLDLTDLQKGTKWHEWLSKNYLCGTELRHETKKIKADDYSGSKFKVFSVIDCDISEEERNSLLFDLGTSSPLNSSKGEGNYAPHADYFNEVMQNRISIFKNWESLCLFDSFTTLGNGILSEPWQKQTWADTYFRIYLFRLFFKYNLYRYNSELHDNTIKLRNDFEKFLNNYKLSHISFNFLPNEMFNKIGEALHLDEELNTFQNRINRISAAIQEEKQSRTNSLLQFVSVLGGIGSVKPVFDGLSIAKKYLGWSDAVLYTILVIILLAIGIGLFAFLMPEVLKKIKRKFIDNKVDSKKNA